MGYIRYFRWTDQKFDTPLSFKEVNNFLIKKNIKIEKYDDKYSSYKIIK